MKKSLPIEKVNSSYFEWLDMALPKAAKKGLRGVMICLYESDFWQAQVLGYEKIDRRNRDWACNWVYAEKRIFDFQSKKCAADWESALEKIRALTQSYVSSDRKGALAIKRIGFLAFGFSDGDIEILLSIRRKT